MSSHTDLIVIGEGIAGLTTARRAAALGLTVTTLEENIFGGLVINIAELEGYPEEVSGVDLASRLMEENATAGVASVNGGVTAIRGAAGAFEVVTDAQALRARAVVIASGARLRRLGVPGEEAFDHRGVSQCADCDGPMFQGEHVVVVGGGDSAFQEAAALARYVAKITVLMRGEAPRARPELVEAATATGKVEIRPGSVVEEIIGSTTVDGVMFRPAAGGDASRLDCAGVFVFVGLEPNVAFAPEGVRRAADGRIETDQAGRTSVEGIYAVGAVRAPYDGRLTEAEAQAGAAAEALARDLGRA